MGSCWPEGPANALFGFRGHRLGLGHPAIGARRKADFFANFVGGVVIEFGQLPIMEDTEIVEIFLDRTGQASKLFGIVGGAARTRQTLEAGRLWRRRNFL